ncbi:MAG: arsenate reductase ArsC [Pseudomonadota bacterium]
MAATPLSILVLCTGNSARSILGEALLNIRGQGRIVAHSAGSQPKGVPHPAALELLRSKGIDTAFARSKSWDEFAGANAPPVDLVITVCDSAAAEACPIWPGGPVTVHWGIPDPAAITDPPDAVKKAFETAFDQLDERVSALVALDFEVMAPVDLKQALADVHGRSA